MSSLGATRDSILSELLIFHEKAENPDFYLKDQNFKINAIIIIFFFKKRNQNHCASKIEWKSFGYGSATFLGVVVT